MSGRRLRLLSVLSSIAAVLMMIVGLYAAYAYYAYNGIQLSERACVDCVSGVTVGGYHLYYREVGTHTSLPPVVLVHGGPGHSSLSFKNAFDFLAAERRVVYYDQRGSGNSQIKADATDYTIERLVDELEGVRRDVVKAEKIDVVGHSFGGAIAQRYALRFPDRVETLTLIGSVRINNGMSNRFVWKWFGPAMYSVELGLPATDANAWFTESANSNDAERLFDKSKASLLDGTGNLSFVPWREILLSAVGDDYAAELRELRVPTLFVYGAADSPYTGKPVADETCSIVPDCRAVGFARSGHWPFLEEPARFQQVMREFLRGH